MFSSLSTYFNTFTLEFIPAHSSLAMMPLTISAGSIPSVRSAGFAVSVPTNTSVGKPWMLSWVDSSSYSSVSTFTMRTASPSSVLTFSSSDAINTHGPHHVAKKSMISGVERSCGFMVDGGRTSGQ